MKNRIKELFDTYEVRKNPNGIDSYVKIHPTAFVGSDVHLCDFVEIEAGAWVTSASVIGPCTIIRAEAQVINTWTGIDVVIGDRALVCGCTVNDRAVIGADSEFYRADVGSSAYVGSRVSAVSVSIADCEDVPSGHHLRRAVDVGLFARLFHGVNRLRL